VRKRDGEHTKSKHYITGMRHCSVSEFEEIGIKMDNDDKIAVS
jgi:hypothetical protein